MQKKNSKGFYRTGTANLYKINLEEVLEDSSLPFSYLLDDDLERYGKDFLNVSSVRLYESSKSFKGNKKDNKIVPINEATRKELLKGADRARINRAKQLTTRYYGVTNARGWITFKTNSQYTPGKKYTQYIKLNEAKDMKLFKEFKKRDIIRLFLTGDLSVYCSCLTGNTKIRLADGNLVTIQDLAKLDKWNNLYVYSVNKFGKIRKGKIRKVWQTGTARLIYKILLNNGRTVTCTGNHPFRLSNGFYRRADKLKIGDCLTSAHIYSNGSIINKLYYKVIKVEVRELVKPIPVYDMSVDKYHNFFVDAGVVLHNCPDFKYKGFKYMGTQMGYSIFRENRFPKVRNPKLEGTICKHLIAVLMVLNNNWMSIAKDMQRSKFFKKHYADDEEDI